MSRSLVSCSLAPSVSPRSNRPATGPPMHPLRTIRPSRCCSSRSKSIRGLDQKESALAVAIRDRFDQPSGLRQQCQVLVGLGLRAGAGVAVSGVGAVVEFPWHPDAVVVAAGADRPVHLLADDRLHTGGPRRAVEPPRPGQRAVVGHGDRPRPVSRGLPADPGGGEQTVAGGVLGVHMQVHELAAHRDTGGTRGLMRFLPRRRCGGHRVRGGAATTSRAGTESPPAGGPCSAHR